MTSFRTGGRLAFLLAATMGLPGVLMSCSGDGSINNQLSLRIIQASPDAPLVNFLIDGVRVRTAANFKEGYGFIFATPRTYDLAIEAILPGDDELIVPTTGKALAAGNEYTFVVIGKNEDDTVRTLDIENPIEAVGTGNFRVQLVHAAPDVGPVDIYFTAPGDILAAATPIAEATYGTQPAGRVERPAGTYIISITPAGVPGTVLFDSSELVLSGAQDLLLVAVSNTTTDTASVPLTLVVNDLRRTLEILDKDLPSDLRTVHVSPDAPALDLVGDPSLEGAANVSFASGITYLQNTGYVSAPPESYVVNGTATADPDTVLFGFAGTPGVLFAGQRATVLAIGLLATIDDLKLVDDTRSVYAEGRLRIVDAAPGSGAVDVHILEPGTAVQSENATLRNLGLRSATNHLGFAPGNYDVTFTPAGETTVLASIEVAATAGTVQTAILVDEVRVGETSDGNPPSILLIDDLAD